MMNTDKDPLDHFQILRAIQRGGLSLWLNRRILLPMTFVPTIVSFLTIMVMRRMNKRGVEGQEVEMSPFVLSIMQIPADFVLGLFSALIIFIIINAPSSKDKNKPVMFTLNILDRKDLLITVALVHVVIGFFAGGISGLAEILLGHMQGSVQGEGVASSGGAMIYMVALMALVVVLFYAVRFCLIPVLVMAEIDVVGFYRQFKSFGLSAAIFMVKFIPAIVSGMVVMFVRAFLSGVSGGDGGGDTVVIMGIFDLLSSFIIVIATAWGYAAMTIGYRQMLDAMDTREK